MKRSAIEVRKPIDRVTMPLFQVENVIGRIWATGVLLQVLNKHFLLTAAHIFDRTNAINITNKVVVSRLFPIGEVTMHRSPTTTPSNRLATDPYDTCVCDLPEGKAEEITTAGIFRFLDLSEVDPWDREDPRSWYTVFGFPVALNKKPNASNVLGSNACAFASFIYLGERGDIPWKDSDRGVGMLFDYGPKTTVNDDGQNEGPPDPRGMSGGGVWRIAEAGSDPANWSIAKLKLIGIQSAVYEKLHVLRGTRIEHSLGFIYRGHPALQREFWRLFGQDRCERAFA